MLKNLSEKIVPVSMETSRRERSWTVVTAVIFFAIFLGSMYSWKTNSIAFSNVSPLGSLCGALSAAFFLIAIIISKCDDGDENLSDKKFVDSFGISPHAEHDLVQNMVNCVLMSMWQSYDEYVQHGIVAERNHLASKTFKSAALLAEMRVARVKAFEPIKEAVDLALDWRYTVPDEVKDFVK